MENQAAIAARLENNPHAVVSRDHPNAEKLADGAVQRGSVMANNDEVRYTSQNPNKIGSYKRAEVNRMVERENIWSSPWDDGARCRNKVCRIYMPQSKHLHCHPTNKQYGKYWALDFATDGHYKSPLMGWTRGSQDPYSFMCSPYQSMNMHNKFAKLADAVSFCEGMGWGYDILHPQLRWHVQKNYSDNFKWKGNPKPEIDYD